jgi:hypothetical protein
MRWGAGEMMAVTLVALSAAPALSFSPSSLNVRLADAASVRFPPSFATKRSRMERHARPAASMRLDEHSQAASLARRTLLGSFLPAAITSIAFTQQAIAAAVGAGNQEDVVLVIGATSTMGQEACKDLLAMGFRVRGFTRRADDVKQAVIGTEFAGVEWVSGDLKEKIGLDTAMKGVKKVIFAPLLATRAGSDPEYFKTAVDQDIQMNRLIFSEGACT